MGLRLKVFFAFFAMILIALAIGLIGCGTISSLRRSIALNAECVIPADDALAELNLAIGESIANRRTLMSPQLPMADRDTAHRKYKAALAHFARQRERVDQLVAANAKHVEGWPAVLSLIADAGPKLKNFIDYGNAIDEKFTDWESTRILNPDLLIANLQQYRGDHYDVLRRLALMVIRNRDDGAGDMTADHTACAFGRWCVSFDNGKELYAENPVFRDTMAKMRTPHQRFHELAHALQASARDPNAKAAERVRLFNEVEKAAQDVVGNFAAMTQEAERAREIALKAQKDTLEGITPLHDEAMKALGAVTESNKKIAEAAQKQAIDEASDRRKWLGRLTAAAAALGLLAAMLVAWFLRHDLTEPLRKAIDTLSTEADGLGATSDSLTQLSGELANGATQQASSLEETSSALEQMASMMRQNADNANRTNDTMHQTALLLREGTGHMENMTAAMAHIEESAEQIDLIIKTIENIAFQTNLLALNAAVEAARAGEAGKGFAVVADEVRSLAQRSAGAARETTQLIEQTVQRVKNGSETAGNLSASFSGIDGSATTVTRLVQEITSATNEQAQGIDQVNTAVAQMDKVTQATAKQAEEASGASREIVAQADTIRRAIGDLARILGGRPDTAPRPYRPQRPEVRTANVKRLMPPGN